MCIRDSAGEEREHERDDGCEYCAHDESAEEPDEDARDATRDERAGRAPQDRAQHTRAYKHGDEQKRQEARQAPRTAAVPGVIGCGKRLALDDASNLVHAGVDAAIEVILCKEWSDGLGDDAIRDRIGQRALEACLLYTSRCV